MPTYNSYTFPPDVEHITTQRHSIGQSHRPCSISKAKRPTLYHLPKMTPQLSPSFPKSFEEGVDRWDGPLWPGQDHFELRKGETEVLPHDYKVARSHINEITAHEDGIDNRSIPLQPGQDHIEPRKRETEVLPKKYRVVNGRELVPLTSEKNNDEKEEPKVEIESVGYEDGIDGWDGPMWPGQDHAGLREGETEVLPEVYRVTKGLKLGVFGE